MVLLLGAVAMLLLGAVAFVVTDFRFPFLWLIFLPAASEGSFGGSTRTYFRHYFGSPRHYSRRTVENWRDTSPQTSILAAAAGGFNRLLLLLSFMFRYSKRVFQEGEVVADSSSALCG